MQRADGGMSLQSNHDSRPAATSAAWIRRTIGAFVQE
jgi:hypothetical protein